MPGMDGATLLQTVKDEYPDIIRVILSGHAEREAVVRALPVCHQFLAKPCEGHALKSVIERACDLQALLKSSPLRSIVGTIDTLPSLPRLCLELTQALSVKGASAHDVAVIIEQDPAMTAKLLQLVNSSYFGLAQPMTNAEQAVGYLGFELLRGLIMDARIFGSVDRALSVWGLPFERLQQHSLLTAQIASEVVSDAALRQDAYTAGLLHDIGKIVLTVGAPATMSTILTASRTGAQLEEAEAFGGVTHAEVGAYLLGVWGLPSVIVEAVAHHHSPTRAAERGFGVLAAVHIADALASAHAPHHLAASRPVALEPGYLESLGVASELPRWTSLVRRRAALANPTATIAEGGSP
jgi:putative nucleotidyltransferase with HDIG domain